MALVPNFIVSRYPEWYSEDDHEEAYTCLDTRGLFEAVRDMMVDGQRRLSVAEKRYRPRVVYKKIREGVIEEAEVLRQKPSRSLLLALMDLVEVLGGNEFGSVATVDRAGLKHALLIYGNYTAYYLPSEELRKPRRNRTVIPVVTQYSEKHNLVRYDARRSMVATYSVTIPRSESDSGRSYFVQEVLFTPGLKSLKLLREIAGTMFDFWDMALEMPTHIRSLAPSFRQIQPCQLLISDETGSPAGDEQSEHKTLASHLEELRPMCCAPEPPDEGSGCDRNKKREASVDCFGESQVKCDLTRFQYDKGSGEARVVYFRRSGRVLDGKRGNLLPVVALRKDQDMLGELYVSTTLRFYRALKRSCVKGNGELMSCWNETLQDLGRDTFISGQEMCQEIHQSALTAFTRRVNPGGWCNSLPRHVESKMSNPTMIEVVELAIALMENRIPSAFAVAELLHCPIERVRGYLRFQRQYASDPKFRAAVRNERGGLIAAQMREGRMSLADLVALYAKRKGKKRSDDTARKAAECAEMLRRQPPEDINKIQKMWYTLSKGDSAKDKDVYANVKVLFLKLRVYHNKLKKLQIPGELQQSHDASQSSCDSKETEDARGGEPGASPERREFGRDDRERAPDPDTVGDRGGDGGEEADDHKEDMGAFESVSREPQRVTESTLYVTPEATPASHWIKNMSTLLLSDPWLNGDDERREAVCTLLRLDETLLNKAHSGILGEWVASNRGVVSILSERDLRDQLSVTLIDRMDSLSTERWAEKALVAFPDKAPGSRLSLGAPRGKMSRLLGHRAASSVMSELQKSRSAAERLKRRYPGEKRHSGAWKSDPRGEGVAKRGQMPRRRSGPVYRFSKAITKSGFAPRNPRYKRDRDRPESVCLSEAEEESCEEVEDSESEMELDVQGEDLAVSVAQDDEYGSSLDEYDYSDGFIDDGPLETGSSNEDDGSSGDDDFCNATKSRKMRGVGGRGPRGELESGRPSSRRGFYSGSEDDDDYPEAGDRRGKAFGSRYKRALHSDDSEGEDADEKERIRRPSKRVKKRESPKATSKDVDEGQPHSREPVSSSSPSKRGARVRSKATVAPSGSKRGSRDARRDFSDVRGGVSGSSHVKKTKGGKGDRIKSSPSRSELSASSPSGSSPSKKQKSGCLEEGCSRRNSPATRSIDRHKGATSGSDSESQQRRGSRTSGEAERSIGHAWSESADEVESELGESSLSDSYAETEECEEKPSSRDAKRERVDQKGVVRSEGGGAETASLRLSRTPTVQVQQSRPSSESDVCASTKIESDEESSTASDTQRGEYEGVDSDAESTEDAASVITM